MVDASGKYLNGRGYGFEQIDDDLIDDDDSRMENAAF